MSASIGVVLATAPLIKAHNVVVVSDPPPPIARSAISCVVVFLRVPASFTKTSSVPTKPACDVFHEIALLDNTVAPSPVEVTSPV